MIKYFDTRYLFSLSVTNSLPLAICHRKEFEELVFDVYNIRADYPFEDDLVTGVSRHESEKWFALATNISK